MPTKEARERAASERAERLAALFAGDTITEGQYNLLTDILIELSNQTGVYVYSPEVVAAFYLAAARKGGAVRDHNELAEALRLIEGGETFNDYIGNDGVRRWKLRRRARANRRERSVAGALHEALLSTETPDDYRAALTEALRAFAGIAYTGYDEPNPRETFLDAAAELAIWPGRSGLSDARLRICDLLDGLKRERPLNSIAPRASKQKTGARPATQTIKLGEVSGQTTAAFGIREGDQLELEAAVAPQPGEVLILLHDEGFTVGRFVRFDDEPEGREVVVEGKDGDYYGYLVADRAMLRPLNITRRFEAPAPAPTGGSDGLSSEARQRIEALRRRLDKLYEPENEAARFKLMREIYDLEHAPACAEDEWPEVVAA